MTKKSSQMDVMDKAVCISNHGRLLFDSQEWPDEEWKLIKPLFAVPSGHLSFIQLLLKELLA